MVITCLLLLNIYLEMSGLELRALNVLSKFLHHWDTFPILCFVFKIVTGKHRKINMK